MADKSFKITKRAEENIANYNKTIFFNNSLKKKFRGLLSVFDTDGSGNLEVKNKDGKNEIEAYFNAILQTASKTGDKRELDINEAQDLIDNVIKNPKIKAKDLVEFSEIIAKTIDVSTVESNIDNFAYRNGIMTRNISALTNIAKTQITEDNVLEVLEKYKKQNGQSFFDLIADYKLVDNNQRKELIFDVFNKLISHAKSKGNDVELLQQLGIEEIECQFNKTGFINKDNINAFFNGLVAICNKKHLLNKKTAVLAANYLENIKLPKNITSKKESLEYKKGKIAKKAIYYKLSDGRDVNEKYRYDTKTQKYVLESREFFDKKNNKSVFAAFHKDGETLRYLSYGDEINHGFSPYETHYFDENGMEIQQSINVNKEYSDIKFNTEGNISEITTTFQDGNMKKVSYSNDGTEYNNDFMKTIYTTRNIDEFLSAMLAVSSEGLILIGMDSARNIQLNFEKIDQNMQKNLAIILFDKCERYYKNDNNSIEDLKKRCLKYIDDGKGRQAWECCRLACVRATQKENSRLVNKKKMM